MQIQNFSKKGFIVLKKTISQSLIRSIQSAILKKASNKKNIKNSYKNFNKIIKTTQISKLYNFINPLNKHLFNEELISKILLEKKLLNCITTLLGRDLAVSAESSLTINLPERKKNYYYKNWHQEIWSGVSVSNVQIWLPIFYKSSLDGQIGFIKSSHKWGHVPHSNRKPLKLPPNFSTIKSKLDIGDVLIFSTTLLHRSMPTKYPRLGLAMTIKNFKYNDYSFSDNFNWKIFSYSETTKIQRFLGNHYLSPFRLSETKAKIEMS